MLFASLRYLDSTDTARLRPRGSTGGGVGGDLSEMAREVVEAAFQEDPDYFAILCEVDDKKPDPASKYANGRVRACEHEW